MSTKEPYIKSTIYDETGGLSSAPSDDGYPILGVAFTPTGPIEKQKVLSQKDFIKNYLTGTTVLPSDHESIQYIYKILEFNPVFLIRACPVTFLEGVTSLGNRLLFDDNYNLLSSYFKFKITGITDNSTSFYAISHDANGNNNKIYYAGATAPTGLTGTLVNVSQEKSIDKLLEGIKKAIATTSGDEDVIIGLQDVAEGKPDQLLSRCSLTFSDNIGYQKELSGSELYNTINTGSLLPGKTQIVPKNANVIINSSTYYFAGSGGTYDTGDSYPVPLLSPDENDNIVNGLFMLKVLAESDIKNSGSLEFSLKGVNSILTNKKNVTFSNTTLSDLGFKSNLLGYAWSYDNSGTVSTIYTKKTSGLIAGTDYAYTEADCSDDSPLSITTVSGSSITVNSVTYTRDTENDPNPYIMQLYSNVKETISDSGYVYTIANIYNPLVHTFTGGTSQTPSITPELKNVIFVWGNMSQFLTDSNNSAVRPEGTDSSTNIGRTYNLSNSFNGATIAVKLNTPDDSATEVSMSEFLSNMIDYTINMGYCNSYSYSYTSDGETISGTDTTKYYFYNSANVESLNFIPDSSDSKILTVYNTIGDSLSSDYYSVSTDGESDITYTYYLSNDTLNGDYITFSDLWIKVGTYVFYVGSPSDNFGTATTVKMGNSAVTKSEFISLLLYNLYATLEIGMYNNEFVAASEKTISCDTRISYTKETVTQTAVEQFAVVQKFPSSSAVFQFSYEKDSNIDNMINITLNYKSGTSSIDWTMSFVSGVVDGYGVDQWFERVTSDYFKIVDLQDGETGEMLDSYDSDTFGDGIAVPSYNVQYMKDAIQSITEYEDGQYYYAITDSGVIDSTYAATCDSVAQSIKSWYPVSLPSDTKSISELTSFIKATAINSPYSRYLAAGDRETISGFSAIMPGSIKLLRGILELFRSGTNEFAPHFDLANGVVSVVNLVQNFKKTDRETLLGYKIETLKGGVGSSYYINDNVTAQSTESYMSENQNVLMTIVAIHTVENAVKTFKARLNTKAVRKACQDAVNNALQTRLYKGKAYTPASYVAVCDETNNNLNTINNHQLIISLYAQFTPSIKYIFIDNYIIPLESAS